MVRYGAISSISGCSAMATGEPAHHSSAPHAAATVLGVPGANIVSRNVNWAGLTDSAVISACWTRATTAVGGGPDANPAAATRPAVRSGPAGISWGGTGGLPAPR